MGLTFLGSYTVQIWWKGDPGVENFVIKFTNEEMMRKWATGLDTQRKENTPTATASPEQAAPDFTWMRNVNNIENPYAQQDDEDEEEDEISEPEEGKSRPIPDPPHPFFLLLPILLPNSPKCELPLTTHSNLRLNSWSNGGPEIWRRRRRSLRSCRRRWQWCHETKSHETQARG